MSHFGILCPPLLGHMRPMGALAEELHRRGHAVSFLGIADAAGLVEPDGTTLIRLGRAAYPAGSLAILKSHMAAPRGLGLFRVIGDMARMTDMLCREAPAAIRAAGIDALVADQLEPAGGLVAVHLKLPFVSVANALPIDREAAIPPPFTGWSYDASAWGIRRNAGGYRVADAMMWRLHRVIAKWGRAWNLDSRRVNDCLSPVSACQLVPGFDFPRQARPAPLRYCGPLRGREAAGSLDGLIAGGRPLAFVSLGTLQGGRFDLFGRIADACGSLGLQVVIAHGGALTIEQEAALSRKATVRSFVPQRALLPHAALAVSNGGLNTVLDALAAGVPLVTVPIAFEQGAIGARLEASGAGISVPLRRASATTLTEAIRSVLTRPSFRTAAGRLAAEIAGAGGVARAADLVEDMVAGRAGQADRSAALPVGSA